MEPVLGVSILLRLDEDVKVNHGREALEQRRGGYLVRSDSTLMNLKSCLATNVAPMAGLTLAIAKPPAKALFSPDIEVKVKQRHYARPAKPRLSRGSLDANDFKLLKVAGIDQL